MTNADWIDFNQRVLVAEFARLRARIEGQGQEVAARELAAMRAAMNKPAAIDLLAEEFELTPFERDVLLLCAGITMDAGLAQACVARAALPARNHASFGLALAVLEGAHWSALTPIRPLRAMRLLRVHDECALTTCRLSIEERVLHYLAGVNYLDPALRMLREAAECELLAPSHGAVVKEAVDALGVGASSCIVQLVGDDATGQEQVAQQIARHFDLRLRCLQATALPEGPEQLEELAALWNRDSALLGIALLVCARESETSAVGRFVKQLSGLVFIASPLEVAVEKAQCFQVRRPGALEQKRLWQQLLGEPARLLNGSVDAVAAQFQLDSGDIARTAHALRALEVTPKVLEHRFWQACRKAASKGLDDLAQPIVPSASWDDLVLPPQQIDTLRQIAAQARHRLQVHEQWGFAARSARGLGISVLFTGESGTGKTMAAEVLANELQLELYRIDLASMVSKYIGETEKNLRRLFDAAEASGAVLLFDEADALFGKRCEVKDSNDRYANIEVSYLLQRMEAYRGLAILTTNLKGAIDVAFQRRLRFVVQFPFPDAVLREQIWRGVFPSATPTNGIDHAKLAQLNVAGGNIRSIALNAAFLAADAGVAVDMGHLLQAARSEAAKRERPYSDAEVRGWQ